MSRLDEILTIVIDNEWLDHVDTVMPYSEEHNKKIKYAKSEILALLPQDREESYYHQNHWKADVYNEAIQDCRTALGEK